MSSNEPPSRRRRIAGERRSARPDDEPTQTAGPETASAGDTDVDPKDEVREDEPTDAGAEQAGSRERWWGSRQSLIALLATLVVLSTLVALGALGMLGNRSISEVREADRVQQAEETAPSVAEEAAKAILAYNYETLDADQEAATRFMTPQFSEQYTKTFESTVKSAARQYKAKVTADVLGSSVVRATDDRVRVLLFVDQSTVSSAHQGPQEALNRVEFVMVQRSGDWLVDDISSY